MEAQNTKPERKITKLPSGEVEIVEPTIIPLFDAEHARKQIALLMPENEPLLRRFFKYPFTAHVYYPIFPICLCLAYYVTMNTYGVLHPSLTRVPDVTYAMFALPVFIFALLLQGPFAKGIITTNSQVVTLWDITLCLSCIFFLWILTVFGFFPWIKGFVIPRFRKQQTKKD